MTIFENRKVALLEDDPIITSIITSTLDEAGLDYESFTSIKEMSSRLATADFDLLILDWQLPDGNADIVINLVRHNLNSKVPILIESINNDEAAIVEALNQGADDYVSKPIRTSELVARIGSLLRRASDPISNSEITVRIAHLELNEQQNTAFSHGQAIQLTRLELKLACFLCKNPSVLYSREDLLRHVWGHASNVNTRTVDAHINQIRRKLGLDSTSKLQIISLRGYGYRCELMA